MKNNITTSLQTASLDGRQRSGRRYSSLPWVGVSEFTTRQ